MTLIRSVSGLRATLGDSLTPEIVTNYTAGFSNYIPIGAIVTADDGRVSGKWIRNIIESVLVACGRQVISLGTVPTPTLQLMVEEYKAAGGVSATASHNPSEWNGMKFLNSDGIFLNSEENEEFWDCVDNKKFQFSKSQFPKVIYDTNAIDKHINKILQAKVFSNLNFNTLKGIKICVDAVNASGSYAIPQLLRKFGAEVVELYCDGSGIFPHTPEPLPHNLIDLQNSVKQHGANFGVAVDPDADRLVLIDENGSPIGEELTLALAVKSYFMNEINPDFDKSIVLNMSSSMASEKIAQEYEARSFRSAVGEINVVKKMKELNSVIGGEGSGGVILPEIHYGRDSLVGIALIVNLLQQSGLNLSELAKPYQKYKIKKEKVEFEGDFNKVKDVIKKSFHANEYNEEDGIRLDFGNKWLHIRKSNTEPILRFISEGEKLEDVENLISKARSIIE